jgi:hypothetical protein
VVAPPVPEIGIVPDVLADGDADLRPREVEDLGPPGGLEVPVLVEDIVGREEGLPEGLEDFPLVEEEGDVLEGTADGGGYPSSSAARSPATSRVFST